MSAFTDASLRSSEIPLVFILVYPPFCLQLFALLFLVLLFLLHLSPFFKAFTTQKPENQFFAFVFVGLQSAEEDRRLPSS